MRVYLVRHPAPAVAAGICYGQADLELAGNVAASAVLLRNLLPNDATLYSSPLRRCRALAEALHPAPMFDPRLMELHFGEWEMQPWDGIERAHIDAWSAAPLTFTPPGGESVIMLRERVAQFIGERSAENKQEFILVVHAGVMKVCCALLLDLPETEWLSLQFDYGTATLIENGQLLWHNRQDG